MNRRQFLKFSAGSAIGRSLLAQLGTPQTVTFKAVDGCELKTDVYFRGEKTHRPALMWIHGGALVQGTRKYFGWGPMQRGYRDLLDSGFVIVSVDYRLAPEVKLPVILEDIRDAYRWLGAEGGKRFAVDPDRITVGGDSAGGFLTLLAGIAVTPRPCALVSYYGYGDIDGPWLSEPDKYYREQRPLVSREDAMAVVGQGVITEALMHQNRGRFYVYCRQQGIWPNEISGHDPHKEPRWFDQYCPVRNVTGAYPPTLLVHGTADTDVPPGESKAMAAKLAESGVKHEFIAVPGAGHGLSDASPEEKDRAAERAAKWIQLYSK